MRLLPYFDMIKEVATLSEHTLASNSFTIQTVPIEELGESFNYSVDELIERAKGKYLSGQNKEGIVVRPLQPEYCPELGKSLSFKVLNNDFLAKEK